MEEYDFFGCLIEKGKKNEFWWGWGVFFFALPKINPPYLVGKHERYLFQGHS